jgi:hypothetical protein
VALVLPFAGVAAGSGARWLIETANNGLSRFRISLLDFVPNLFKTKTAYLAILPFALAAILDLTIPRSALVARQYELQKSVGIADLDAQLYEYDAKCGIKDGIATDYICLGLLPELNKHYRQCDFKDFEKFQQAFQQPGVGFALFSKQWVVPQVWSYFDDCSRSGKGRFILDNKFYCMFKKEERR